MEKIKDQSQPKAKGGKQKVLLDRAITAETDELDPQFEQDKSDGERPSEARVIKPGS